MLDRTVTTIIDSTICVGCGACLRVCPSDTLSLMEGRARVTGSESLSCDHCGAVCPNGAIRVRGIDRNTSLFHTFTLNTTWTPHGDFETAQLVNLMRSRRSCRDYLDKPVEKTLMEDLVKIGISAPSGSNCQMWTFTLLPDRQSVLALGSTIKLFFESINRLAGNRWIRFLTKLVGKPELSTYYENYYSSVREKLLEWEKNGTDFLFHGAPAVIVVGSRNEASCAAEDALLATQNILLAAHTMGLGTCLIGFAVNAINRERKIARFLNHSTDETTYAVIALGYPNETYRRVAGRKPIQIRYKTVGPNTTDQ